MYVDLCIPKVVNHTECSPYLLFLAKYLHFTKKNYSEINI